MDTPAEQGVAEAQGQTVQRTPIPGTLGYFHRGWKTLPPDLDKLFRASPKLAEALRLIDGFADTRNIHECREVAHNALALLDRKETDAC